MNIEDQILFGHITLSQVREIIDENEKLLKEMNLNVWRGKVNGRMCGRILDDQEVLFERMYHGHHKLICWTLMQFDFNEALDQLQRNRNRRPSKRKGDEEDKFGWNNRKLNQDI